MWYLPFLKPFWDQSCLDVTYQTGSNNHYMDYNPITGDGRANNSPHVPSTGFHFGTYNGEPSPTNSVGSDIKLLKLNPSLEIEPFAIHKSMGSSDMVSISLDSMRNVTIRQHKHGKLKIIVKGVMDLLGLNFNFEDVSVPLIPPSNGDFYLRTLRESSPIVNILHEALITKH